MFGNTSSSGGSGALSHAYIHYPPLKCINDGSRGLFYDDGNKLLISPTSNQVVSWKTSPFTSDVPSTTDTISEGPVLSVRYSLDLKLIAVQRSNHEVQFWIKETGDTFSQKSKSESDSILGFFWTDCAVCDIVFVKTSGLDLYTYAPELKSLELIETKKMPVSWYMYTHESRLVLLASGMQCKSFTGYQLSSAGVIRLPRFEMAMAKTDVNSKPVLAAEDVHIVNVYGRIYCLQVDRVAMLLHSYRFYRDAVIQQVVNDLLNPAGQNLRIREDSQGTFVEGIKEEVVLSPAHALSLIAAGEEHRHVGLTNFNLLSSRSHTIFTLNLIDLPGSESSKAETTGVRRKEGSYINKSLLTLGTVISKLTDTRAAHIPYRDSKLTRLLQSSLSGHGRVSLICTVTPSSSNLEETHNTLKFPTVQNTLKFKQHKIRSLTRNLLSKNTKMKFEY